MRESCQLIFLGIFFSSHGLLGQPARHTRRPRQLGHGPRHVIRAARHPGLGLARYVISSRQDTDGLDHHARRQLCRAPQDHVRPQPLCAGRGAIFRRPVCAVRLVGQDPAPLGHPDRQDHPQVCRPLQRRPSRLVLARQPPDRVVRPRQTNQAVEHPWRVQADAFRRRPHRMGLVRQVLAKPRKPRHCLVWLGQAGQGKTIAHMITNICYFGL